MYLSRLYINNFRSIRELDLRFSKGKNVIIGRNNTGKSNIVKALDLVLGESNPTYAKSENITDTDFYSWKETLGDGQVIISSANDIFIWCELERNEDEPLNYDEICECSAFNYYKEARFSKDLLPKECQSIFDISEENSQQKTGWVNPKKQDMKAVFDDKNCFAFALHAAKDSKGGIKKDIRFLYRESKNSDWILSLRATIRNELLQSAIIPSFRDPQNQLRSSNWTWYGKLMKHLTSKHQGSDELKDAFAGVREVAEQIFSEVTTKVAQSALEVAFPGTTIHIQLNPEMVKTDLYKSCLIYVDDGFKSQVTEKGSGIQSAIIIGLFNYYTRYVNTKTSALLCIEEPEIYLHPHARRVISDRLDDFLDSNRNQVIITTHSAEFIRTISEDLNVILVQKDIQETRAIPVGIKKFKHLLIDNNKNELFFADKVIICEGLEEHILRIVANQLFPQKLDEQNISIINAGGKDSIKEYAHLARMRLGLKCFIFADFDYLIRDKGIEFGKWKKPNDKYHDSIDSLGEDFFAQECLFGGNGKRVFQGLQRLRANLKINEEQAFYTAKTAHECKSVNLLQRLRCLR